MLTKLLDLPHATLLTYVGIVCAVLGYLNGDLTLLQAFAAAGVTGIGAGQLGVARNGSGRGIKKA